MEEEQIQTATEIQEPIYQNLINLNITSETFYYDQVMSIESVVERTILNC